MQTIIKPQLLNLPRITLEDLLHKNQITKKQKKIQKLQYIRTRSQNQANLLDVKTPFYVNRFEHHKHNQCNVAGKCLACRYNNLKPFEIKVKKDFLKSSRKKIGNNRIETQRMSEDSQSQLIPIWKRFRSSQGYDQGDLELLKEVIKFGIENLDEAAKQKFYTKANKKCSDQQITDLCLNYVRNSTTLSEKLSKKNGLTDLANIDVQQLFDEQYFIKYIKSTVARQKQLSTNQNRKVIQILNPSLKKRKSFEQQCSIKIIEPDMAEKKVRKKKKNLTNIVKKKVKIMETQSDQNQLITQTRLICSQYFIDEDFGLSEQVKAKLNEIAKKKYKRFKGAVQTIDDYLQQQVNENPDRHQAFTKKLQIATDWMKMCIPQSDKHEDLKLSQIDKLVSSITALSKNIQRRGSLKKDSKQQVNAGLSKFEPQNNQLEQKKPVSRKSTSKSRQSRKTSTYLKSQLQLQRDETVSDNEFYNQRPNKKSQNLGEQTQKLIEQELYDKYEVGNFKNQPHHPSDKHEKRKSEMKPIKASFLKHTKEFHPEEKLTGISDPVKDQPIDLNQNPHFEQKKLTKKQTQIIEMERLYRQIENIHESDLNAVKQKQNKKRIYLKIRAAQLLRQNQEIIEKAQKHLKNLDLCNYIINSTDCVLTQKKKIRHLRQIIRLRSLSRQIQETVLNEIIRYLCVYEENCQILMEKYTFATPDNNSSDCSLNLKSLVSKRQIYNQLLFYDLKKDFQFGKADDEEINYSLLAKAKAKADKSWEISTKKIPAPYVHYKRERKLEKFKTVTDDLVQRQMSEIAEQKLEGIVAIKVRNNSKYQLPKKQRASSAERFLMTQNA